MVSKKQLGIGVLGHVQRQNVFCSFLRRFVASLILPPPGYATSCRGIKIVPTQPNPLTARSLSESSKKETQNSQGCNFGGAKKFLLGSFDSYRSLENFLHPQIPKSHTHNQLSVRFYCAASAHGLQSMAAWGFLDVWALK